MSTAVWLHNQGMTPILIERRAKLGGLFAKSHFQSFFTLGGLGRTGTQVTEDFVHHVRLTNTSVLLSRVVSGVERTSEGLALTLRDVSGQQEEQVIRVRALVIATGTRFRCHEQLRHVPGLDDALASGRLQFGVPPSAESMNRYADRDVVVLGGGSNAYELAERISRVTRSTHLVVRDKISAKGCIRQRIHTMKDDITIWRDYALSDLSPLCSNRTIFIRHRLTGRVEELPADLVSGQFGYLPNSESWQQMLPDLAVDERGYIAVDRAGRSSVARVYAAGDVANPDHPSVTVGVAMGAIVAMSIEQDLRDLLFPMA